MTPDPQQLLADTAQAAVEALRAQADERWVQISDRILTRSQTLTRRSLPVRAASAGGPVNVSEQVLIAGLRQALADLPDAAVVGIHITTDHSSHYTGLQITINVPYGPPILPVADDIRQQAQHALSALLGPVTPPVTVTTIHVHVQDVDNTRTLFSQ